MFLLACLTASAQSYEKVPFGDFEHWTVRYVTESQIVGGQEKVLYVIGPTDTIRSNDPYKYKNTIWASSNALARMMGVVKVSNNVTPDDGPTGKYAKLATEYGWQHNFRVPVIYGDARKAKEYQSYMDLISGDKTMYALNSKGKKKVIQEEEWAEADCPVTHAIMMITSSSQGAFVGAVGNVLWVDEIRLEY